MYDNGVQLALALPGPQPEGWQLPLLAEQAQADPEKEAWLDDMSAAQDALLLADTETPSVA